MLVNDDVWAEGTEVFYAANMVRVPMSDESLRYRNRLGGKDRREVFWPRWLAFTSINQKSIRTLAKEISIGALKMVNLLQPFFGG